MRLPRVKQPNLPFAVDLPDCVCQAYPGFVLEQLALHAFTRAVVKEAEQACNILKKKCRERGFPANSKPLPTKSIPPLWIAGTLGNTALHQRVLSIEWAVWCRQCHAGRTSHQPTNLTRIKETHELSAARWSIPPLQLRLSGQVFLISHQTVRGLHQQCCLRKRTKAGVSVWIDDALDYIGESQ